MTNVNCLDDMRDRFSPLGSIYAVTEFRPSGFSRSMQVAIKTAESLPELRHRTGINAAFVPQCAKNVNITENRCN
jgi:hypothetical protein